MLPAFSDPVKVLVVDDVEKNLLAMQALLERPGLELLCVSSGEAALELLLQHEVALALVDVNMPGMDGFELAELMRSNARTRTIPVIFITAALHDASRAFRGYQAGAVDFLYKPFEPDVLRSKVDVFVALFTQRKQLELHAAELKHAIYVNDMFNAVLGHDLRTPLAAVMTGAEVIMHTAAQPNIVSTAARIRSSGERMEKMVAQLLALAGTRSGEIPLELANGDYGAVCEQIICELTNPASPQHGRDDVRLTIEGNAEGLFDKHRIAQVLSNLVANALLHRTPGTLVEVTIDGSRQDRVSIRVGNEGCIEADVLSTIFEPYRSGKRASTNASGLGLGLYIVKRLAAAHGGAVTVQSSVGEGTQFEVALPRIPPNVKPGIANPQ